MKKLILLLSIAVILFAETPTTEALFLDIYSDFTADLPMRNPAYLDSTTAPYNYAFSYSYLNTGGDYKLPFSPDAKNYHNIEVSAYQEMDGGLYFGGRFAYRNEERIGKLWLHNAETNIDVPFYFGDSTSGDFNLNGIDWNIIFSYPLSKKTRIAMDVFYNVDEQFKSVFPKPNSKRNNLHLRPAVSYQSDNLRLGIIGSYFNFKEEIETKKYSLEQNRTPAFMRIRGLDRPLLSYAETSEERLQAIDGFGASMDLAMFDLLTLQGGFEEAQAQINDGGTHPVDQGSWWYNRFNYRADLYINLLKKIQTDLFFLQEQNKAHGFHPTLEAQIYNMSARHFEGGLGFSYNASSNEAWNGTVSYAFEDLLREDTFLGLSHYIPAEILHLGMDYTLQRGKTGFNFNLAYESKDAGDATEYNELSDWYYQIITKNEIAYYAMDTESILAGLEFSFPYQNMHIAISGNYEDVRAMKSDDTYHAASVKIELRY